jgi:hypothetical protein
MAKTMKPRTLKSLQRELGKFVSVRNMMGQSGNVPNQFIITYENGEIFQSYDSIIAVKCNGLYLSDKHDYSATTNKYCIQFTNYNTKERHQGLENGTIRKLIV